MRAWRRLRRLERAEKRRFLASLTLQERVYYMRLWRRLLRDDLETIPAKDLERANALLLLHCGEGLYP
jgi:hypothetical protein